MSRKYKDQNINPSIVSVEGKQILHADELSFRQMPQLSKAILELLSIHKLTIREVSDYLRIKRVVNHSEAEVISAIELTITEGAVLEITENHEIILKPARLDEDQERLWQSIDRTMSRQWIQDKLNMETFYSKSAKIFDSLYRVPSYNRVYRPTGKHFEVLYNNKPCVMFSSNDYLGLSRHPQVIKACQEALLSCGNGTGGSRILTGTTPYHRELERVIASFKGVEDAVVFNSGFMTNLAMLSMMRKDGMIFYDALSHVSTLEGIKLSGAAACRFRHNDMEDLEAKLKEMSSVQNKLICIEGIYSMEGDFSPLKEVVELAKKYGAFVAIDEAHSSGTVGATGKGVLEYYGVAQEDVEFKMGTLGKAFGSSGGYIYGSQYVIDFFKYSSKPFLFSTSLPASAMAGAMAAFQVLAEHPELPAQLQENARYVRESLKVMGFNTSLSQSRH
jgi:7-keto-8-aminopelargonate synthetase-like enzyme